MVSHTTGPGPLKRATARSHNRHATRGGHRRERAPSGERAHRRPSTTATRPRIGPMTEQRRGRRRERARLRPRRRRLRAAVDAPPDGLHPRRPAHRGGRNGCPFCAAPGKSDAEGLIVHRGEHCYVVMNLFPYNPGHVLVCPYRHVSLYVDLTDDGDGGVHGPDEAGDPRAPGRVRAARLQPRHEPGRRRGRRRGRPPAPAHRPPVERRLNFLPIVGQTKALPVLLEETRKRLVASWT